MLKIGIRRSGFTLIELLVVIAIISVLASILLPSLKQAQMLARRAACISNHHSLSVALNLYANDFEDNLPLLVDGNANNSAPYAHKVFAEFSTINGLSSGLGLLYKDINQNDMGYVSNVEVFFCPASEDKPSSSFPRWSFCSYYYRFMGPEGSYAPRRSEVGAKAIVADKFGIQAIMAILGNDSDDYYYHNEAFPTAYADGSVQVYIDNDRFIRDAAYTWGSPVVNFVHHTWIRLDENR